MNIYSTPRMQLSPDVPVTQAFRAEVNAWMIDFFGYNEDEATAVQHRTSDEKIVIAPGKTTQVRRVKAIKPTRKSSKTQVNPDNKTLASLLDGLDVSFKGMSIPDMKGSWLESSKVKALKKMGMFVPDVFDVQEFDQPKLDSGINMPSMASALFVKRDLNDKLLSPRFAFVVKQPKLPCEVEQIPGTAYQFGLCYQLKNDESGNAMKPQNFWMYCWVVVDKDRNIKIPHEVCMENRVIRHRTLRSGSGVKTSHITLKTRRLPALVQKDKESDNQERKQALLACTFRQLLLWWTNRESQWSVGVRKDGHRCTFSIDQRHTAGYFADRDTVVNVDGKPKKIIHFVRQHERVNGSMVKAHVRGLREFDWHGYHCVVTAPKFNGALTTMVDLTPVEIEDDDKTPIGYVEFAEVLAAAEDAA